ncbi:protein adenylyltransferase FICD-like isoform X1 [Planococcus citri]|uniref:protein adenylyltransferase FICD-like isoform X1 n=1 Tax=Planococcus citri TaxID=170843 RepID=UPI0031F84F61
MVRLSIVTGVILGIGILLITASICVIQWNSFKRRRRTIPEILRNIELLRNFAVKTLESHPDRITSALAVTNFEYVRHTLMMEGIPGDDQLQINCIIAATNYVTEDFKLGKITEANIRTIHAHVMRYEHPEIAGQFRDHDVSIRMKDGSISIPPSHTQVVTLMNQFIAWLNEKNPQTFEERLLLAAEAKLRLVVIHPFSDGNGRVSRALFNGLLRQMQAVPYVSIPCNTKQEYFSAIRMTRDTNKNETFTKFILLLIEQSFEKFNKELSSSS